LREGNRGMEIGLRFGNPARLQEFYSDWEGKYKSKSNPAGAIPS